MKNAQNGLLLYAYLLNKRSVIPLTEKDIIGITLIKGKEEINPFFLSPMSILLKLKVSILFARYFRFRKSSEYSIGEMKLNLKTIDYEIEFIASGYLFERQLDFFKSLGYEEKLKVELNKPFLYSVKKQLPHNQ